MATAGALTLGQLVLRCEALAELEGFTNADNPPDWAAQVNAAYLEACWEAETHTETLDVGDTVAGQAEYDLGVVGTDRAVKLIHEVWVGTTTLLTQGSEASVRQADPRWLMATSGTPATWWRPTPWVLRLHPAPSTAGLAITARVVRCPAPMAADDYPDLPEVFHSRLADRAYMEEAVRWVRGDARQALQDNIDRWRASLSALKGRSGGEATRGVALGRSVRASDRVTP